MRRVAVILVTALVLGAGGGAIASRLWPGGTKVTRLCAGVGLVTDTSGYSPDHALKAFVVSKGGKAENWERTDARGEHNYRPKNDAKAVPDFSEVHVEGTAGGSWQVTGACA